MVLLEFMGGAPSGAIDGGTDIYFGLKDVIVIGAGIITFAAFFFSLKFSLKSNKESVDTEIANLKKDNKSIESDTEKQGAFLKGELSAAKKEADEKVSIIHNRINKVQEDIKSNQKDTNNEFKGINANLNKIIGMLEENKK